MVHGCDQADGAVRLRAGPRVHDHPAVRLRDLGADPGGDGQTIQGDRSGERVLPDADPGEPAAERGGARGRLRAGSSLGDPGRDGEAAGAASGTPDFRNDLLLDVLQVGADLAGPADDVQPVVLGDALGEGNAPLPADERVPLAGRPHDPRDGRGSRGRDPENARGLPRGGRGRTGAAGLRRAEERQGKVRRRAGNLQHGSDDAGRQGAAGGHEP